MTPLNHERGYHIINGGVVANIWCIVLCQACVRFTLQSENEIFGLNPTVKFYWGSHNKTCDYTYVVSVFKKDNVKISGIYTIEWYVSSWDSSTKLQITRVEKKMLLIIGE